MSTFMAKLTMLLSMLLLQLLRAKGIKEFDCGSIKDHAYDSDVTSLLKTAIDEKQRIDLSCIPALVHKNFYGSATYLFKNYYRKRNLSQKAIWEYRTAMKATRKELKDLYKLSQRQQTSYVERNPPTLWAQSLEEIQMEIKFGLRHGVPGCINIFDLDVKFGRDTFNLTAYCYEGEIKMKYVLNLHLWGTINPEESYFEELSVGGLMIYMEKDPKPGRWMTLCFDEKPENVILWYEQHKKWHHRLEEFDRDEIYDYEGWDIDSDEDDESEEIVWNKPLVRKKQVEKKWGPIDGDSSDKPKKKKKKSSKSKKSKGKVIRKKQK